MKEYRAHPPNPEHNSGQATDIMNQMAAKGWRFIGIDGARRSIWERDVLPTKLRKVRKNTLGASSRPETQPDAGGPQDARGSALQQKPS